jgi:hypothetical protein
MAERKPDLMAPARNQLRALSKDARTIERVKKAHGHKPRVPWSRVKQELGLD